MKKTIALLLTLVMALSLVACGGTGKTDSTPSVEAPAETTLTASDSTDSIVSEVPAELTKVVSLAPATTQIIEALGMKDKLVAVDTQSPLYVEGVFFRSSLSKYQRNLLKGLLLRRMIGYPSGMKKSLGLTAL